jgi:anaerobic ribonucleoside-triphosphate reductase activating protein
MKINISRVHYPITTLGPGRRIGVWFQGCSIRCSGCISADTWASGRGELELDQVLQHIEGALPHADGITISGGEPFDQTEALAALLKSLRQRTAADVLVYSGYAFEKIVGILPAFDGLIDALISEPFLLHAPQTLSLRGSDNQRLHLFTELGRARFAEFEAPSPGNPAFDVMFDSDGTVWLAGIPRRGDLQRLAARLREAGHVIATTEDASMSRAELP